MVADVSCALTLFIRDGYVCCVCVCIGSDVQKGKCIQTSLLRAGGKLCSHNTLLLIFNVPNLANE